MSVPVDRVILEPSGHPADGNAVLRHPAERASWIWHPDVPAGTTAVLRFRRRLVLAEAASPLIHVTGDQRFQLRCDGREVSFGPDRCDVEHWTVHSLRLPLPAGEHELDALVWWLAGSPAGLPGTGAGPADDATRLAPMAQMSWRGGFLLAASDVAAELLDTGVAGWTVQDVTDAVGFSRPQLPGYHDVGPSFHLDLARWHADRPAPPAAVVLPPLRAGGHGVRRPGWCLYPAELPEQRRQSWTGGRIRAVRDSWPDTPWQDGEGQTVPWQRLLDGGGAVTVPGHSRLTVLWDLGRYRCGYPALTMLGGAGADICLDWAESLYEEAEPARVTPGSMKGHRGRIDGKVFVGFGDRWRLDGAAAHRDRGDTPYLWWRSGRYLRLRIATGQTPLTVTRLGLLLTGYPLSRGGAWQSSDPSWDRLMPLFENSYRVSAHETWTDSPYYEQMCYVGDALLSARSNYAWFPDDRLSRRALRMFDWSRHGSGLVAERYPSAWRQESATYALLWPIMIRDYAWWRDDPAFVRDLLPGLRGLLAEFDRLAGPDHLLRQVPGWPFIDWVPEWDNGCGPGVAEGDSSIVNLHWVLALLAAADVERAHGDPRLAQRNGDHARLVFDAILDRYWDNERGILLDTRATAAASEHAQMFALLTGLLDARRGERCLAALQDGQDAPRFSAATIAASHFLLEALYRHGQEDAFWRRLAFWPGLTDQEFTATPEMPEPSRSDAHAWGSHPAWHTLASIAGVRPDAPGFARVRIAPMPGPLTAFTARVVHPRGTVDVAFHRSPNGRARYTITLPAGIDGRLVAEGRGHLLTAGGNAIDA
jgi:hypothetical protein